MVYGELLIGDRGGRNKLLAAYERIQQADMAPHNEVVGFVRDPLLHGRGAGWIDIHLLASVTVERLLFWTADERLALLARNPGVAYEMPA